MRRRTESGRHFSSDEDEDLPALMDGSGRAGGLPTSGLSDFIGVMTRGDGIDTPRGSFSNDEAPPGPVNPDLLSQTLGLKIGGTVGGPGDFRSGGLMKPKGGREGGTKDVNDLKVSVVDTAPAPPPVGTPVGTPTQPSRTFGSRADTPCSSSSSSGGEGPSLPPGIPVRRRRSSAAREGARSIALAKKSQHIVSNLEAAQHAHNPNLNVMQKNREKAEAEEERR